MTPMVEIQTLGNPTKYGQDQLRQAILIAGFMNAYKLILCEEPRR